MLYDMRNCLEHMRGQSVRVDGTVYEIDLEGIARKVAAEHAAKLARNRAAWSYLGPAPEAREELPRSPAPPTPPEPVSQSVQKRQRIQNEDLSQTDWVDQQLREAMQDAEEPPAIPMQETPPLVKSEPAPEGVAKGPEEGPEEWPDPVETMELSYLREMADAYEVSYTGRTGKARLVRDILSAMYPDGREE